MKRLLHLLAQAVLLVIVWVAIFEFGFRLQQYFGPLYDLEMANVNLNWESDVVNHQATPEKQSLCYKSSFDAEAMCTLAEVNRTRSRSATRMFSTPLRA
jgi:hypothetical protein